MPRTGPLRSLWTRWLLWQHATQVRGRLVGRHKTGKRPIDMLPAATSAGRVAGGCRTARQVGT